MSYANIEVYRRFLILVLVGCVKFLVAQDSII